MNHDVVLALVSAVWVALEFVVGLVSRTSVRSTGRDRGSYTLLIALLLLATFAGAFVRHVRLTGL